MTGKSWILQINAENGVEPERLQPCTREKIDAKDAGILFEMTEYDYFCYVLTGELAHWQAQNQYGQRTTSETWIEEAKNQSALAHI